ncbi:MarR family winged helix-turn-helix transcriptional regulator [Macrococcus capreoli]|uniref:MarR family winged helix-turn-helix transcriptional regulator n=1 Tax=Macrococcus capreoli TaxID=2982690 RepID=UPI0021D5CB36|nr:MarR family transcriptional regulator [Macrococcus sp. TMW 2.2395]MCU7558529.1 MarR family transcriptional regulator [Macrococcus sp. TMW 2.2395]
MNTSKFRKLSRSISRGLIELEKDGVSCCGLPMLQSHILIELGETSDISLNELSNKLSSDKASVSRAVQSLVEKEFVVRKTEERDRRSVILSLSSKGLKNVQNISEEMEHYTNQILSHFNPEEIENLFYYLEKLDNALNKVDADGCKEGSC